MTNKNIAIITIETPSKGFVPYHIKKIPTTIAMIAQELRELGHSIEIFDNYLKPQAWLESVKNNNYDIIALFVPFKVLHNAKIYVEKLAALKEEKTFKIAVFGDVATFNKSAFPETVDFILQGDAIEGFKSVLKEDTETTSVEIPFPQGLHKKPSPAFDLFINADNLYDSLYDLTDCYLPGKFPVFELQTVFGGSNEMKHLPKSSFETSLTPIHQVIETIKSLKETYQAEGIHFTESNFAADKAHAMDFCYALTDANIEIDWCCTLEPGSFDAELIALMKKSGCKVVTLNIISAGTQVLTALNVPWTLEEIIKSLQILNQTGMKTVGSFVVGAPMETDVDRMATDKLLQEFPFFKTDISTFVGLPGSALYDELSNLPHRVDENGLMIPTQWESIAKRYLGKTSFSGEYEDVPLASCPIPPLVFHKTKSVIEKRLEQMDTIQPKEKAYLFGANDTAKALIKTYKLEDFPIKGVFDVDFSKSGRFRPTKLTVYHETEIKKLAPTHIFITEPLKEDAKKVKEALMSDVSIYKKPQIFSMFYEDV